MPSSKPQVAFLAAALVLLVLPVLVALGLGVIGMAMHLGMTSHLQQMMHGDARGAFVALFIAWVVLVLAVVLALVSRLMRRNTP